MTLEKGHASYKQLQNPSIPTFKSLYFFNLTNPEAFEEGNATAVLQEVGPYNFGYVVHSIIIPHNNYYLGKQ